jgi:fibronectin-binding autotransporter adhesin
LEIRQLLATVNWISATSGSWDVASNWSSDRVPGAGDDVTIDKPGVTVTISSNVESVNSITADDPLVISGGGLTIAADSTISGPLTSSGHLTTDGILTLSGNDVLTGGRIDGSGSVSNTGTLTFNGSSSSLFFTTLNNSGTVNVDFGTVSLDAGGATQSESGTFNVASGATLDFINNFDGVSEGDVELNAGTALLGDGLYELDLGTLTVNTNLSVANLTVTGGTLNGLKTVTVTQAFDWSGGDLDGAGTTTAASGATLAISGSSTKFLTGSHILNNVGTGNWTGTGEFDGSPGSTFNNSGTFTAQNDANFGNGGQGAGVIFNNSGTFTKSGTAGTTSFSGNILNNSGTVAIDSGTLSLDAGGATQIETGTFDVASGSTLDFVSNADGISEGDVDLKLGTQLKGSGIYELDLGTITVNTDLSVANCTMTGGTLNGASSLAVTGTFDWSGGDLDGAGTTNVSSGGTLNISSANTKSLTGGHTLTNQGTALWSGIGPISGNNGSMLNSSGTFTAQSDATLSGIIFTSTGTFTKAVGLAGQSTDFVSDVFNNTGTTIVQQGTLELNCTVTQLSAVGVFTGGDWEIDNNATLDIAGDADPITTDRANVTLSSSGAVFTNLSRLSTNAGTLDLEAGATITAPGNLSNPKTSVIY